MSIRVAVARYNPQHSHRLAVALQKQGMLANYYTGFYASWQHQPLSCLRWLPLSVRGSIDRHLLSKVGRQHPELDPKRVRVLGVWSNVAMALLLRCGAGQPWEWMPFRRSFIRFEREVAKAVCHTADMMVLYDTNAYHALVATQNAPVVRILDMASTHWGTRDKLFRAEIARWPEFRGQIALPSYDPARYAELAAEPSLADYILVGSDWAKATCVEHGCEPNRVYVVHYGVETSLFRPPSARRSTSRPYRMLFVGSNSPVKGFHYLTQVLGSMPELDIEVWFCGRANTGQDAFRELRNSGRIKDLGFQSHGNVAKIMRQVDMLFHPSILDSFSLTCLEAMASGLPILTTPRSGVAELVHSGRNGFVVPYGDTQAMARVVRELFREPKLRFRVGDGARDTAKKYTWKVYEEKIAQVFQDIAARGKPDQ